MDAPLELQLVRRVLADYAAGQQYKQDPKDLPFDISDVREAQIGSFAWGHYAVEHLRAVVALANGDRWRVDASCDTTGWDCQADFEAVKLPTDWDEYSFAAEIGALD